MLNEHVNVMRTMTSHEIYETLKKKLRLSKSDPEIVYSKVSLERGLGLTRELSLPASQLSSLNLLRRMAGVIVGQGVHVPITRQLGRHQNAGAKIPEQHPRWTLFN